MKRLAIVLAAAMLLSLFGCASLRPANPVSDFEYRINAEKGTVSITKYIGVSKDVVVPSKIEGFPVKGVQFAENDVIETVVLPDSIEFILGSFMNCANLQSVVLGENVKEIWDYSFYNCPKLKTINFPDSLKKIGVEAFYKCTSLEKAILPTGLEKIGAKAFNQCTSLKEVFIPRTVNWYGMEIFTWGTSIEKITFEPGLELISGYAMFGSAWKVKTLTIPASVKEIQDWCFAGLILDSVTFLGDAPSVCDDLFANCPNNFVIYYDPNTSGWDNTPLSQYNLVAR